MGPKETFVSLQEITSGLILAGICDDQNFVSNKQVGSDIYVTYNGFSDVSVALRDVEYIDIYKHILENRQFNFRMLDGGIIQMNYAFNARGEMKKHRLCYFPSPSYESFQNDPDLYLDESHYYSDVVKRSILPVPIRFDFDPINACDLRHPVSHLTLGQFKNCRIPVSAPLCPGSFVNFILRSFYCVASLELPINFQVNRLGRTILKSELDNIYIAVG